MRRIVLGIFAAIGIVAALMVLGAGIAVWRIASSRPALPKSIILTAELGRDLAEGPRQNEVSDLRRVLDVAQAGDRAGSSSRPMHDTRIELDFSVFIWKTAVAY